jgi:sialic acid synthase SpsE
MKTYQLESPEVIKVIAEIGINHNGCLDTARQLINASASISVDAVKFQYRNLSRCYGSFANEIGDEILSDQLFKTYLSPSQILELTSYAKSLGLKVGISFFTDEDIKDFTDEIHSFDFFKIPSPEFDNLSLINSLIKLEKKVFLSTGARSEEVISRVLGSLKSGDWNIFHCISNYPTQIFNAKLGYIKYLKKKWQRDVGYSSHDENWSTCIAAMTLGAKWIERHITLDKKMDGLDHSTSSTPEEFALIVEYAKYAHQMLQGDAPRTPNQGELMNLQNLGRSFYFSIDRKKGEILKFSDLDYRSPATGIGMESIDSLLGNRLSRDANKGDVLSLSLFSEPLKVLTDTLDFSNLKKIALPARFHDLNKIRDSIPVKFFEMHLSYMEINADVDINLFRSDERYSIHLPDYISSTEVINPFSKITATREKSLKIIKNGFNLAKSLSGLTGHQVPVVASFSIVDEDHVRFYENCKELANSWSNADHCLTFQNLPPFAWYFGGSVPIGPFSSWFSWEEISRLKLPITLDLSHLMMSCNYHGYKLEDAVAFLLPHTKHLHLSLAEGVDGEGIDFKNASDSVLNILNTLINTNCIKVIEVWQGHLNSFKGFKDAVVDLHKISIKNPG